MERGAASHESRDPEIAYYTCPMHSHVREQEPGTCPICGMTLTPVTKEELTSGVVKVGSDRLQSIGVKTEAVARRPMEYTLDTVGIVTADERRLSDITLKYEGWIRRLFVDYTGRAVRKGEPLFTIYSPSLLSAQEEYLQLLQTAQSGLASEINVPRLIAKARERLLLWDVQAGQIDALEKAGKAEADFMHRSPIGGVVLHKDVFEGSHVMPGKNLYRIADLSVVWVLADIYEYEFSSIRVGQETTVRLQGRPGADLKGNVDYMYPYLAEKTRTRRVRIVVPNPDMDLLPDMYADVAFNIDLGKRVSVPRDAVIFTGTRNFVFIEVGDGRFQPREIRLGVRSPDYLEVIEGLSAGERIVSSGTFLIASESRLKSAFDTWTPSEGGDSPPPATGHAGHSH